MRNGNDIHHEELVETESRHKWTTVEHFIQFPLPIWFQ